MNVKVMNRSQINKLLHTGFPENTVVISFFGFNEKPVWFEHGEHKPVAWIRKDIDDLMWVDDLENWHKKDFEDIARFILNNKDRNFICQCEMGVSRSAATAMAILEFFDRKWLDIYMDDKYSPNRNVFKAVYKNLIKFSDSSN